MLSKIIELSYELPDDRQLAVSVSRDHLLDDKLFAACRRLHDIYEKDVLVIPSTAAGSVLSFLESSYGRQEVAAADAERFALEDHVFSTVGEQIPTSKLRFTAQQLEDFFDRRINDEYRAFESRDSDALIEAIRQSSDPRQNMVRLIVQFSIEFLSEGSNMAMYVPGSFGRLQANLFRILSDEMGNGVYEAKHSRLFEKMCQTLGLSDIPGFYKEYFLTSNFLVSNYMYSVCKNKKSFFRYLGVFFRNEACFVNWQSQLGALSKEVFGDSVDRSYFEIHAEVDQLHGRLALQDCVGEALRRHGDEIVPEILRGYYELSVYQDLLDMEFRHHVAASLECAKPARPALGILDGPSTTIRQGERRRIIASAGATIVVPAGASGSMTGSDAKTLRFAPGKTYALPEFYPVWIGVESGEVVVQQHAAP